MVLLLSRASSPIGWRRVSTYRCVLIPEATSVEEPSNLGCRAQVSTNMPPPARSWCLILAPLDVAIHWSKPSVTREQLDLPAGAMVPTWCHNRCQISGVLAQTTRHRLLRSRGTLLMSATRRRRAGSAMAWAFMQMIGVMTASNLDVIGASVLTYLFVLNSKSRIGWTVSALEIANLHRLDEVVASHVSCTGMRGTADTQTHHHAMWRPTSVGLTRALDRATCRRVRPRRCIGCRKSLARRF